MTNEYTIYQVINLMNTSSCLEHLKNILRDSATNLNCKQEYFTHETEGINCTITKNNIIYVAEFENIDNLQQYVEFTKTLTKVKIELICESDVIIYMSKQYEKTLDTNSIDKKSIQKKIEKYKTNNKYNKLYKLLQK